MCRSGCGEDTKALKPGSCTEQHSRDTDGRTEARIDTNYCRGSGQKFV